jgi:hypothetical protein
MSNNQDRDYHPFVAFLGICAFVATTLYAVMHDSLPLAIIIAGVVIAEGL